MASGLQKRRAGTLRHRSEEGSSASRARFPVFTCDRGAIQVDLERDDSAKLSPIVQELVESGFWRELAKFPPRTLASVLPHLVVPRYTARLLEIWIEERRSA